MALYSEITPSRVQGPYEILGIEPGLANAYPLNYLSGPGIGFTNQN